MTNEEKDKKEYELGLLLKSEDEVATFVKLVVQHNGEVLGEPRVKRLALSYEIKGISEAAFAYFNFRGFGDDVKALEQELNTRQDVIRFLLVIATPPNEHRAPMGAPGSMPQRSAPRRSATSMESAATSKSAPSQPLSNEALEKKIEEILK